MSKFLGELRWLGAQINDPVIVTTSKAALVAWSKSPGVSPPLSDYGTPTDLLPTWGWRDGVMLHAFLIWANQTPTPVPGSNPVQAELNQAAVNALAAWAGGAAGGVQPIPPGGQPTSIPGLPPLPPGFPPIPPLWPTGPGAPPWPFPIPQSWPSAVPWPPLAAPTAPAGWPSNWTWPPTAPAGWPAQIPFPLELPGWGPPPPPQPQTAPPPQQPTQPPLPPAPAPIVPAGGTTKKSSMVPLLIGAGIVGVGLLFFFGTTGMKGGAPARRTNPRGRYAVEYLNEDGHLRRKTGFETYEEAADWGRSYSYGNYEVLG